jgi:hypothetical protein
MSKLKNLAMMYAGMAGYWMLWFWWQKPDRNGLTSMEKFGLWLVEAFGVIGTSSYWRDGSTVRASLE